ncbi:hypothetical protein ElyMa_004161400 [Elysia marginata]|uniref:Niemann-Pick C1 N-terminal domain-containing protein n=1 Tax=Elysia marginata TaxID=1093978 RepID=A0AAV4GIQ8_9GAST|nr:hypothetical protein ElyMa_004161400 [Elysia marginata]
MQADGTFKRQEKQIPQSGASLVNQHVIQCASVPYSRFFTFLQVFNCPQGREAHPDGREAKISHLCTRNYTTEMALDDILPYVDVNTGLLLRNKFCALCNGYSVEVKDNSLESKEAVMWQLNVTCDQYQDFFNLTSMRQFVDTANAKIDCSVVYETSKADREPTPCFSPPLEEHIGDSCDSDVKKMCQKLNNTYLSLSGFRNLFCFMCEGREPTHRDCMSFDDGGYGEDDGMRAYHPGLEKDRVRIAPLSLLLGLTPPTHLFVSQEWLNCSSDERWFDENVSVKYII